MKNGMNLGSSRRDFLKGLGSVAAFSILPSSIWASSPSGKLQVAQIGVGGRGKGNMASLVRLSNMEIVALCDVDSNALAEVSAEHPKAETFKDYRELFEKMGDRIDAVLVCTPDHMHAPISTLALELGKHVYCEKPLAHAVVENRELRLLAEKKGLVTQMGIQVSASIGQRMTVEYIRNGLIGKISEVHVWSNKSWGSDDPMPISADRVPDNLDWGLWLGVAEERLYRDGIFHPGQWRRLMDFGTGTLGDMGVHIFDTPYRALKLTSPKWVRSECREPNGYAHPVSVKTEYQFPSTAYTAKSLKWTWYDGDNAPPAIIPGFNEDGSVKLPAQGCVMIGEKGSVMMPHMSGPQSFPKELIRSVPRPELEPIDHHAQWVDACLGKGTTGSPFSYGGPLCEALQLGVVASRFPGEKLNWNPQALRISNVKEANQYLSRQYRPF
jgi:predicted dehydrogenase